MAKPKTRKPTDEEREEANWFTAFVEPARLRILRALVAGSKTAKELRGECGIPQPNIGGHLDRLERVGLITSKMEGLYRRCTLAADAKVTKDAIAFTHESGCKVAIPLG